MLNILCFFTFPYVLTLTADPYLAAEPNFFQPKSMCLLPAEYRDSTNKNETLTLLILKKIIRKIILEDKISEKKPQKYKIYFDLKPDDHTFLHKFLRDKEGSIDYQRMARVLEDWVVRKDPQWTEPSTFDVEHYLIFLGVVISLYLFRNISLRRFLVVLLLSSFVWSYVNLYQIEIARRLQPIKKSGLRFLGWFWSETPDVPIEDIMVSPIWKINPLTVLGNCFYEFSSSLKIGALARGISEEMFEGNSFILGPFTRMVFIPIVFIFLTLLMLWCLSRALAYLWETSKGEVMEEVPKYEMVATSCRGKRKRCGILRKRIRNLKY